jgi:hypothetical protein
MVPCDGPAMSTRALPVSPSRMSHRRRYSIEIAAHCPGTVRHVSACRMSRHVSAALIAISSDIYPISPSGMNFGHWGPLFRSRNNWVALTEPTARDRDLRGIAAVLVVAVLRHFRGTTAVCATVHSAPPAPADWRRFAWRAGPELGSVPKRSRRRRSFHPLSSGSTSVSFGLGADSPLMYARIASSMPGMSPRRPMRSSPMS